MNCYCKNLIGITIFCFSILFTSCMPKEQSNNYQSFSELVGTIVTLDNVKYFRWDEDGTLLYSTYFNSTQFVDGDRLIIAGSIDYNDQIPGTLYIVTKVEAVSRIKVKPAQSLYSIEKDTFNNDAILGQTWSYIIYSGSRYYYTSKSIYNASNLNHTFELVNNRINLNDTLKFELRHNNKSDSEKSEQKINLTSFDLTNYLDSIPTGKTKNIQILYRIENKTIKQNISFKK